MLTQICAELKNYFCQKGDILIGDYSIIDGVITPSVDILNGQYYRIVGSVFNDGVHKFGDDADVLIDEPEFHGAVWLMRVPQAVVDLAKDVADWQDKYGSVESQSMAPYQSESFGGYSYTKTYATAAQNGSGSATWQSAFANRLSPYRRIRVL